MKRIIFTLFGLLACLEICAQLGYRYEGKFIKLTEASGPYYVLTKNNKSKEYLENIANKESLQDVGNRPVFKISENSFFVSSVSNLSENDYISEMFQDSKGNPYYVLPRIILSLKDNAYINDVIKRYNGILCLDSDQRLKGMTTLTCSLSSAQEVLRIVGELDSFEKVDWCEPDMICKWETHDSNPLFIMQYYLQNNNTGNYDINVVPAWGIITGSSNITVAVIDEGIDPDHEDLSGNVLQGYTIGDTTGYGLPKNANALNYKGHGVACAGIIGAKNNQKGILGVAYGVHLLPVNVAPYMPYEYYVNGVKYVYNGFTTSNTDLAYAIQWAADRADILSCSWGGDSEISTVKTAINNAMSSGRNGKGCVFVASSGNDYPYLTTLKFPARMDGVIAVGAIDKYGSIQPYSQRGSALDLVAPSGQCNLQGDVVTTDRPNTLGYNPYGGLSGSDLTDTNYTQLFGGTSAACPQVAGVAALMLSANPDLPAWNVRYLLQNTARKLPGMNGQNRTDEYGYGLVDAYNAVRTIRPNIEGANILYTSETYYVDYLLDGSTVSWSLTGNNASNFILQEETPSSNQCTINRKFGELFGDTTDLVLSAQIMHNGIVINTITKSLVTPHISGSSDPCGSTVYSIAKLPAGLSVDWSINPAVSIFFNSILTTNSPQQNQCTIYNDGMYDWATNLYAAIKNSVGDTIATLVKPVRSTFDLLFSQEGLYGYPTIPLSPVESNGNIIVNHKCLVDLVSPYFEGMTISHTGASPSIFLTSFDGKVTFRFPTITSTQYMTIHGTDGCKVMNLHVQVTPNGNIPIPMLEANPISGGYEILLTYENDEEATRSLTDKEWTLNVVNASSSEKEISWQVKGQRTTISTANWKQGVYVLQGIVDGQECTKKIVVK